MPRNAVEEIQMAIVVISVVLGVLVGYMIGRPSGGSPLPTTIADTTPPTLAEIQASTGSPHVPTGTGKTVVTWTTWPESVWWEDRG